MTQPTAAAQSGPTGGIAIVGSGLMGRVLALTLRQTYGPQLKLTLFERDPPQTSTSCGLAGAGMLTPFAEMGQAEALILELATDALNQWAKLINTLNSAPIPALSTLPPVFFQRNGSLLLSHSQESAELIQFTQQLNTKLAQTSLNDKQAVWQTMDGPAIAQLEPDLEPQFEHGIFFPLEGQLCSSTFFARSTAYLAAHCDWHQPTTITGCQPHFVQSTTQRFGPFTWVFDCRGLGARTVFPKLRAVRGERLTLHAPDIRLQRMLRLLHPRYPLYIAPRPNQQVVIGASMIEAEDFSPPAVQTVLELLSAVYSLDRRFSEARLIDSHTHCRPALPNHLPKIRSQPGLTHVNGLFRHGYLLAPCLAACCLAILEDKPIPPTMAQLMEI